MENKSTDPQNFGRSLKKEDLKRTHAEHLVASLVEYIGGRLDDEHLVDTPKRVIKSFDEIFSGYKLTPEQALGTTFRANGYDQMVICKDIEIYSTCSHHMIPFFGKVHIGYIPGELVVGLSKLARLAEVFSRRLQLQERLTQQIADSFFRILKPKGVMVVCEARHLCMCARGVGKQHSNMVTSAIKGAFTDPTVRSEFMSLIK